MQETLCSSILVDNKEIKPFTHLSFTYHCNHLKNVKNDISGSAIGKVSVRNF